MKRPRDDKAESARREHHQSIRPQLEESHRGKVVALDLDTGEYELASDTIVAARRLRARRPKARIWLVRVGHEALYRLADHLEYERQDVARREEILDQLTAEAQEMGLYD